MQVRSALAVGMHDTWGLLLQASDNWTRVTFSPDLSKFGMEELEADTVALMRKRVYDMAGILGKGVKVCTSLACSCMRISPKVARNSRHQLSG